MFGMTTSKFNEISANLSTSDVVAAFEGYKRFCVLGRESMFSATFATYFSLDSIEEIRNDLEDIGVRAVPLGSNGLQVLCYDGVVTVAHNWTQARVKRYTKMKTERTHKKWRSLVA